MQTYFADGILNIAITGPLVRIDYGTATPVTNAEGKQEVRLNPSQQVVMPMEGFVRALKGRDQPEVRYVHCGKSPKRRFSSVSHRVFAWIGSLFSRCPRGLSFVS
ncbi:MAG: hypothetical protein ABTS22_09915 [Accumulibacter sp.]|uniref:hypothetical protein n=1 Tax=Accumulibacter sp. TaxID=2053492 RepID=UPI0033148BDA